MELFALLVNQTIIPWAYHKIIFNAEIYFYTQDANQYLPAWRT